MNLTHALERLNALLPLKQRQDQLSPAIKKLHQDIIHSLVSHGHVPNTQEMESLLGLSNVTADLVELANNDLIVMDQDGTTVIGAYPITLEPTPHTIRVHGNRLFAMCALDAVSVAPMFDAQVDIESQCHLTQVNIKIQMQGNEIITATPSPDITLGIRWQNPGKVAAHSLCMEMVFLANLAAGHQWQSQDRDNISLFSLPQAVLFGAAYFLPLMNTIRPH